MKKLICVILTLVMALSLVACGETEDEGKSGASTATVKPTTAEEIEAANAEIRYALGLLLDRNYIVEEIGQAGQVPASSFVAMGMTDADGSEFYKNAGSSDAYDGYYDVSKEAYEANYAEAYEILVDNQTALNNVSRFAKNAGKTVSFTESGEDYIIEVK